MTYEHSSAPLDQARIQGGAAGAPPDESRVQCILDQGACKRKLNFVLNQGPIIKTTRKVDLFLFQIIYKAIYDTRLFIV